MKRWESHAGAAAAAAPMSIDGLKHSLDQAAALLQRAKLREKTTAQSLLRSRQPSVSPAPDSAVPNSRSSREKAKTSTILEDSLRRFREETLRISVENFELKGNTSGDDASRSSAPFLENPPRQSPAVSSHERGNADDSFKSNDASELEGFKNHVKSLSSKVQLETPPTDLSHAPQNEAESTEGVAEPATPSYKAVPESIRSSNQFPAKSPNELHSLPAPRRADMQSTHAHAVMVDEGVSDANLNIGSSSNQFPAKSPNELHSLPAPRRSDMQSTHAHAVMVDEGVSDANLNIGRSVNLLDSTANPPPEESLAILKTLRQKSHEVYQKLYQLQWSEVSEQSDAAHKLALKQISQLQELVEQQTDWQISRVRKMQALMLKEQGDHLTKLPALRLAEPVAASQPVIDDFEEPVAALQPLIEDLGPMDPLSESKVRPRAMRDLNESISALQRDLPLSSHFTSSASAKVTKAQPDSREADERRPAASVVADGISAAIRELESVWSKMETAPLVMGVSDEAVVGQDAFSFREVGNGLAADQGANALPVLATDYPKAEFDYTAITEALQELSRASVNLILENSRRVHKEQRLLKSELLSSDDDRGGAHWRDTSFSTIFSRNGREFTAVKQDNPNSWHIRPKRKSFREKPQRQAPAYNSSALAERHFTSEFDESSQTARPSKQKATQSENLEPQMLSINSKPFQVVDTQAASTQFSPPKLVEAQTATSPNRTPRLASPASSAVRYPSTEELKQAMRSIVRQELEKRKPSLSSQSTFEERLAQWVQAEVLVLRPHATAEPKQSRPQSGRDAAVQAVSLAAELPITDQYMPQGRETAETTTLSKVSSAAIRISESLIDSVMDEEICEIASHCIQESMYTPNFDQRETQTVQTTTAAAAQEEAIIAELRLLRQDLKAKHTHEIAQQPDAIWMASHEERLRAMEERLRAQILHNVLPSHHTIPRPSSRAPDAPRISRSSSPIAPLPERRAYVREEFKKQVSPFAIRETSAVDPETFIQRNSDDETAYQLKLANLTSEAKELHARRDQHSSFDASLIRPSRRRIPPVETLDEPDLLNLEMPHNEERQADLERQALLRLQEEAEEEEKSRIRKLKQLSRRAAAAQGETAISQHRVPEIEIERQASAAPTIAENVVHAKSVTTASEPAERSSSDSRVTDVSASLPDDHSTSTEPQGSGDAYSAGITSSMGVMTASFMLSEGEILTNSYSEGEARIGGMIGRPSSAFVNAPHEDRHDTSSSTQGGGRIPPVPLSPGFGQTDDDPSRRRGQKPRLFSPDMSLQETYAYADKSSGELSRSAGRWRPRAQQPQGGGDESSGSGFSVGQQPGGLFPVMSNLSMSSHLSDSP
ncbi:hypothetical protein HDU86_000906 [Geranomyces michiganensis]|nr:hypothetical protein HDU86_000906 [Geranomyces michiganensis]